MREVKSEVNNATAGRCKVGLVEEDAEEEALHDGSHGEGEQKEKEDGSIAIVQHSSSLQDNGKKNIVFDIYTFTVYQDFFMHIIR